MATYEFYDTECIDGYFAGTVYIYEDTNTRFILDFGYDIEFEKLSLSNCNNFSVNSCNEQYSLEEIQNVKNGNSHLLISEMKYYIRSHYPEYYNLK